MRLIPCPVCQADLVVMSDRWVDCPKRHRARTDPRQYEKLRLDAVMADIRDWLCLITDDLPTCASDHTWTNARGIPELPVRICVRCLTLAILHENPHEQAT